MPKRSYCRGGVLPRAAGCVPLLRGLPEMQSLLEEGTQTRYGVFVSELPCAGECCPAPACLGTAGYQPAAALCYPWLKQDFASFFLFIF